MTMEKGVPTDSDIETLIMPSVKTIMATYEVLKHSLEKMSAGSKALLDTIQAVADVLALLTGTGGAGGSWQLLSPFTLPIPFVLRGLMPIASRLIKERTGISVDDWTSFVNSAREQFKDYLAQLDQVSARSEKYSVPASSVTEPDLAQLSLDEELMRKTLVKTRLLKPVLSQLGKLNQMVDMLLESENKVSQVMEEKPVEAKPGIAASLQNSIQKTQQQLSGAIKDRTVGEHSTLPEWMKRSLDDFSKNMSQLQLDSHTKELSKSAMLGLRNVLNGLRERARQLNQQIKQVSDSIVELEDLLGLELAQLQAYAGKISAREVRVLSQRVAATIIVPRLKSQLAETQKSVTDYQTYLRKLDQAHKDALINDTVFQTLVDEYQRNLAEATRQLEALESQVNLWKSQGPPLLTAGLDWMHNELETVRIRELVGQFSPEDAKQTSEALGREVARLEKARSLVSSW